MTKNEKIIAAEFKGPILEVNDLSVSFHLLEGVVPAVAGLDLVLKAGEVLGGRSEVTNEMVSNRWRELSKNQQSEVHSSAGREEHVGRIILFVFGRVTLFVACPTRHPPLPYLDTASHFR